MHQRGSKIVRHGSEDGTSLVEYGLMLALIAVVAFSAVAFFGNGGEGMMQGNCDKIAAAQGQSC